MNLFLILVGIWTSYGIDGRGLIAGKCKMSLLSIDSASVLRPT
jgi:hypothetical protein